jgi:DNA-directed RNA polymerase subunit beta'
MVAFDFFKISLASSKHFKFWGTHTNDLKIIDGQIKTEELVLPKSLKPAPSGLFCETIFGPVVSFKCSCFFVGTIKTINKSCLMCNPRNGSFLTRKYRMGYIKLNIPIVHIWYLNGSNSIIGQLLDISVKELEKIIYFLEHPFTLTALKNKSTGLKLKALDSIFYDDFMGSRIIEYLLTNLNLKLELFRSRLMLHLYEMGYLKFNFLISNSFTAIFATRDKLIKRIRLLENFISTKALPSWMVLKFLPILPPLIRPLLPDDKAGLIISDLNILYLNIIRLNNRLLNFSNLDLPIIFLNNEKRFLQEAVDELIDNGSKPFLNSYEHNPNLKSLSSNLRGKYGRFRYNLLGKRVDYSGRSVIVVGPYLKLYQCGLPFKIASELFEPFLIRQILRFKISYNLDSAKEVLKNNISLIRFFLVNILKHRLILLNRAPTLHRLGIQAFEPVLVHSNAILLHPLVCNSFNADFDGDQMSIHIPVTLNSQKEVKNFLYAPHNLISSTTNLPILVPSQDMIIGYYFLTLNNSINYGYNSHYFNNYFDILAAYQQQEISLHSLIWVKESIFLTFSNFSFDFQLKNKFFLKKKYFLTSFGRLLFSKSISKTLYC